MVAWALDAECIQPQRGGGCGIGNLFVADRKGHLHRRRAAGYPASARLLSTSASSSGSVRMWTPPTKTPLSLGRWQDPVRPGRCEKPLQRRCGGPLPVRPQEPGHRWRAESVQPLYSQLMRSGKRALLVGRRCDLGGALYARRVIGERQEPPTKKHPRWGAFAVLAEAQGFEPWNPFGLPVFKTGAIDHSAKLPGGCWAEWSPGSSRDCMRIPARLLSGGRVRDRL